MNTHIAIQTCQTYRASWALQGAGDAVDYMDYLSEGLQVSTKFFFKEASIPRDFYLTYTPCPFPVVFYEFDWNNGNHHGLLIIQKDDGFVGHILRNAEVSILEPQSIQFIVNADKTFGWRVLPFMRHMFNDDEVKQYADESMRLVMAVNQIMACRNITCKEHAPARKLIKKREKNNKPPLYEYRTLEIKSDRTEYLSKGAQGKHKSPRFHMRRGHIRRLKNKSIWIQQTTVGNKAHGIIEKEYKLVR